MRRLAARTKHFCGNGRGRLSKLLAVEISGALTSARLLRGEQFAFHSEPQ
jgi:hypothetical protein